MSISNTDGIFISGVGVSSAIGQGKDAFFSALINGETSFAYMKREGRQLPTTDSENTQAPFIGAEIATLNLPEVLTPALQRTASLSAQLALTNLAEAWSEAELDGVDPTRVGLIVGGSNVQQREQTLQRDRLGEKVQFLRPSYAMSFMDTDICGICTELFPIRGMASTCGGASASGQLAVIQAVNSIKSGLLDVCIVIGAMMDISYWECQGFRSMGAMGSDQFAREPSLASRPFDKMHDGFIFGEASAAVVIESENSLRSRQGNALARILGTGIYVDGNRNPNPSMEGEATAIRMALAEAAIGPDQIHYINPHGTGSVIGDETELQAFKECGLKRAVINTTKSIIGHGLSAAGTVELVATVLQIKEQLFHPSNNLENPILNYGNWILKQAESHTVENAINMSMGFGGMNTAVCLQRT